MRRLFRAAKRAARRLARPLRLRWIDWRTKQSCGEVERLCDMRDDAAQLIDKQKLEQVRLELRREAILKGLL